MMLCVLLPNRSMLAGLANNMQMIVVSETGFREHFPRMQKFYDRTSPIISVLEANVGSLTKLRLFYSGLMRNDHFPEEIKGSPANRNAIHQFERELDEIVDEFKHQISKLNRCEKTIADLRDLVSFLPSQR